MLLRKRNAERERERPLTSEVSTDVRGARKIISLRKPLDLANRRSLVIFIRMQFQKSSGGGNHKLEEVGNEGGGYRLLLQGVGLRESERARSRSEGERARRRRGFQRERSPAQVQG